MAFIRGERLQDVERPPLMSRIVVKVTDVARALATLPVPEGAQSFLRYFDNEAAIAANEALGRYLITETDPESARSALERIRSNDFVEEAYIEAGPSAPPLITAGSENGKPEALSQGYLDAAPLGVDARFAWSSGLYGLNVTIVDLEQGWLLNHEDLPVGLPSPISGVNYQFHGHGAAVLSELAAPHNGFGVLGIAPDGSILVVSAQRSYASGNFSVAQAIVSTIGIIPAGGILLIEAEIHIDGDYWPVEIETAVFDAIRGAVNGKVVVVEAAGNGGEDLDLDPRLEVGNAAFRDSGAILVAAASSTSPHVPMSFSNRGSRIDCYSWGESISAAGNGAHGTDIHEYTSSFGGTSGASPIVAGAAALIQSWALQHLGTPFAPAEVRELLRDRTLNTESAAATTDKIGVQPNLSAILELLRTRHGIADGSALAAGPTSLEKPDPA